MGRFTGCAAVALLLLTVLTGCGSASSGGNAAPVQPTAPERALAPTPIEAESIVASLWSKHDEALNAFQSGGLEDFESGSAAARDAAYIEYVLCGCTEQIAGHPRQRIVPLIPRSGETDSFLAQVQTRNSKSRDLVWYVVGIVRDRSGAWKLGFYTFAGYGKRAPLPVPVDEHGYAPAITEQTENRVARLAEANTRAQERRMKRVNQTGYGAVVHSSLHISPDTDGIYGFALPGGRTIACYTVHQADEYSSEGGLFQDGERNNWGPLLEPGDYRTVVIDGAVSVCDLDKRRLMQHTWQHVAVSGAA